MIIALKEGLKLSEYHKPDLKPVIVNKLSTDKIEYVSDNIAGDFSHCNYLSYLEKAWDCHYGVVVTPDIIWYTLLCELTGIVSTNSEKYRKLFTRNKSGKEDIIVISESLTEMPLDVLVEKLKHKVPTNTEYFLPKFSTTNERSLFASYAAFCDMVAPYYEYSMMMCGHPAIDVQGEVEDWQTIKNNWDKIGKLFKTHSEYFAKVSGILDELVNSLNDTAFWKKMFLLKECGSGHQYNAYGWITDLFVKQPANLRYTSNFSSHVSVVKYKQLDTDMDYEMKQGLFGSYLDSDNFLRPDFAQVIYRVKKS